MNLSVSYYTTKGGRSSNEDSISLLENKDNTLAMVADGLGGHQDGAVASESAVRVLNHRLTGRALDPGELEAAIEAANEEISRCQEEHPGMKTTLALLWLDKQCAYAAHVGDSRIYQFRNKALVFQSIDHSVSQMAVMVGEITADQIRGHKDRNKLVRALGAAKQVKPDIRELEVFPGDAFLLCTDGFWELITEAQMQEALSYCATANEWLLKMRQRVDQRSGAKSDNQSAVAIIIQ